MRHGVDDRSSLLVLAATAAAHDLGNQAAAEADHQPIPRTSPTPTVRAATPSPTRAVIPSLPYSDTGTTAGYTDDYDEVCPYSGSTAPDVVYSYTPVDHRDGDHRPLRLQLRHQALRLRRRHDLVACNDDYYSSEPCGVYVSAIENLALQGGEHVLRRHRRLRAGVRGVSPRCRGPGPVRSRMPRRRRRRGRTAARGRLRGRLQRRLQLRRRIFHSRISGAIRTAISSSAARAAVTCTTARHGAIPTGSGSIWVPADLVEVWADAERPSYLWAVPRDCGTPAVNWGFAMGECHEGSEIVVYNSPYVEWVVILPQTFSAPPAKTASTTTSSGSPAWNPVPSPPSPRPGGPSRPSTNDPGAPAHRLNQLSRNILRTCAGASGDLLALSHSGQTP